MCAGRNLGGQRAGLRRWVQCRGPHWSLCLGVRPKGEAVAWLGVGFAGLGLVLPAGPQVVNGVLEGAVRQGED